MRIVFTLALLFVSLGSLACATTVASERTPLTFGLDEQTIQGIVKATVVAENDAEVSRNAFTQFSEDQARGYLENKVREVCSGVSNTARITSAMQMVNSANLSANSLGFWEATYSYKLRSTAYLLVEADIFSNGLVAGTLIQRIETDLCYL